MAAGGMNADGFTRCYIAVNHVAYHSLPCVDHVLKTWHTSKKLPSCSSPTKCKNSGKPTRKHPSSCPNCVACGKAVEDVYYPQSDKGGMPWGNVSPLCLPTSHVEVAKAFVLRLKRGKQYTKVGHFDAAGVLMIMMHFGEFHYRDQNNFNIIKKVFDARNDLSHKKSGDNLYLDDQQVDDIFSDIDDLITCLERLHPLFTSQHARDIRLQLRQIKTGPVTAEMKKVLEDFTKSVEAVASQISQEVQTAIKDSEHRIVDTVKRELHQTSQEMQTEIKKSENLLLEEVKQIPTRVHEHLETKLENLTDGQRESRQNQSVLSQELTHKVDNIPVATCRQLDPKLKQLSRDFLNKYTDLRQELEQGIPIAVQEQLDPKFEQVHQTIQEKHRELRLKQEELSQEVRGVKETIQADLYKRQPVFDVNTCRRNLKTEYRHTRSKLTLLPGMPEECADMDDLYIELDLLEEEKTPTEIKIKRTLKSADELFTLQTKRGKYCKRILVRGGPGSGKSTTISKLAYDWAHEKVIPGLPYEIDLLFALDLREIQKGMNLIDAIQDQLLPKCSKDMLISYIESHAESVVFLLDGFDEAIDVPQHGDIKHLLSSKWLQDSLVIVTTRPLTVAQFANTYGVYSHIQLTGFSREHMKEYVLRFLQVQSYSQYIHLKYDDFFDIEPDCPTELQKELEDIVSFLNNLISSFQGLCYTPITLSMLCLMWSEDKQAITKKITEIYGKTFLHLAKHTQTKFTKNELNIESLQQQLNKIVLEIGETALSGLFQDRLVFKSDEFNEHTLHDACQLGLLTMERKRSKCSAIYYISFFHKTFQEYCAAKYWTSLLENDEQMLSYLQKVNDDNVDNMKMLLQFCCGLSCEAAEIILPHIVGLTCDMDKLTYMGYTGFKSFTPSDWVIPLALLYETGTQRLHTHLLPLYDLQSSQSFNIDIPHQHGETYSFFLESVLYNTESIKYIYKDATELRITLDNSFANHQRYLKIFACASKLQSLTILFEYMKDLNQFQNAFIIHEYDIPCKKRISSVTYRYKSTFDAPTCTHDPVVSFMNQLISLRTLHFNGVPMVDIVYLLQSLDTVKPIEELEIQGSDGFTELFIEALYSLVPGLQRLSINEGCKNYSVCKELSTVFIKVGTGLHANKAGADTLAERFQGKVQNNGLVNLPCKELVFTQINISADDALKLGEAFNYLGNLQVLRLQYAEITNDIGSIISQHFCKLPSLEVLDLSGNRIGVYGGSQFGRNLCHLPGLLTLDLSRKPFSAIYDGSQIGRDLLQALDLSDNPFGGLYCGSNIGGNLLPVLDPTYIPADGYGRSQSGENLLQALHLNYNPDNEIDHLFHGMKSLTKLQHLFLSRANLNERNISQLGVSLTHMPDLQELNLCENHIGTAAEDLCNGLKHLTKLEELNISQTIMNEDGILCLASSLIYMPELKYLDLGSNTIGSAMGDLCDGLQHMTKLQKLILCNTAVTDYDIAILPLAHLTELRELDIQGDQQYGPQGVEHLFRNLHHVRHLDYLIVKYNNDWHEMNAFLKDCNQVCSFYVLDTHLFLSRSQIRALMRFVEEYNSEH